MNNYSKKNILIYASSDVMEAEREKNGNNGKKFFLPFSLPSSQFLRLLIVCLIPVICSVSIPVLAQTALPVAKSRPIYDQCASFSNASGKPSADNDDVAKAIAALKEKDQKAREQAAALLGKSCDARAVEPLHNLLKDEDPMARIAAVEALGRLGDKTSVDVLIEMIYTEKDWRVRMAMVSSMLSFKSGFARAGVLNGIANPQGEDISDINDLYVRCSAILSCNQLTAVTYSKKAILFLRNFLTSKYPTTRQMAEQTLYELKNTRNAASEFRGMLKSEINPEMRRWAAEWMGKIGFENVSEVLTEAAANDPEPKVKQAAATALAALKNAK
ncbi:MAG TPA: HEAT repeat domain-containing protein [Blastocatellia bacterium]|nr:HEAT repeat domain-containing protein [Blastocatellia bacterium]